jgi:hypothetical protein
LTLELFQRLFVDGEVPAASPELEAARSGA